MQEAFGAVGERLGPQPVAVIRSPVPDGDHGLASSVSLSVNCPDKRQ